jgi:Spy/CpxP family protein refolding chaperone
MRNSFFTYAFGLFLAAPLWAQSPAKPPNSGAVMAGPGTAKIMFHRELGKWWKDSDTAKKLQLSNEQITQLDQTFYDHRLKLIDFGAEMEKEDLKLQTLLDADVPNEAQVDSQVDQVLVARGKLEREYTMMNLDLRKVLSLEQWRQLKSIRGDAGGFGDRIFYRKIGPGGAPGAVQFNAPAPAGAPLPPLPSPDEMF